MFRSPYAHTSYRTAFVYQLLRPTAVVWEDYIRKTNVQNNTPSYLPEHIQPNMPAMQYFEKAQSSFKPPLVANENAFLGDVASS